MTKKEKRVKMKKEKEYGGSSHEIWGTNDGRYGASGDGRCAGRKVQYDAAAIVRIAYSIQRIPHIFYESKHGEILQGLFMRARR